MHSGIFVARMERVVLLCLLLLAPGSAVFKKGGSRSFCPEVTNKYYVNFVEVIPTEEPKTPHCGCVCDGAECLTCPDGSLTTQPPCEVCADGRMPVPIDSADTSDEPELHCVKADSVTTYPAYRVALFGDEKPSNMDCNIVTEDGNKRVDCVVECSEDFPCQMKHSDTGKNCGEFELSAEAAKYIEIPPQASVTYTRTISMECDDPADDSYGDVDLIYDEEAQDYFCVADKPASITPGGSGPTKPTDALCVQSGAKKVVGKDRCILAKDCPAVDDTQMGDPFCGPFTPTHQSHMKAALRKHSSVMSSHDARQNQCVYSCASAIYRWEECANMPDQETLRTKLVEAKKHDGDIKLIGEGVTKHDIVMAGFISCADGMQSTVSLLDSRDRLRLTNQIDKAYRHAKSNNWQEYVYNNVPQSFTQKIAMALQEGQSLAGSRLVELALNDASKLFHDNAANSKDGPGKSCRHWAEMAFRRIERMIPGVFKNGDLVAKSSLSSFDNMFDKCVQTCQMTYQNRT